MSFFVDLSVGPMRSPHLPISCQRRTFPLSLILNHLGVALDSIDIGPFIDLPFINHRLVPGLRYERLDVGTPARRVWRDTGSEPHRRAFVRCKSTISFGTLPLTLKIN